MKCDVCGNECVAINPKLPIVIGFEMQDGKAYKSCQICAVDLGNIYMGLKCAKWEKVFERISVSN